MREVADGHSAVHLLGGPYVVVDGRRRTVPEGGQRLLAFLVLRGGIVDRREAAGTLWPDGGDDRAAGNLRSSIWRLRAAGIDLVNRDGHCLSLLHGVRVDVDEVRQWAGRLIDGRPRPEDLSLGAFSAEALNLLPGWYDDWTIVERERLRQRVLHAAEAMSRELSRRGRHADAVEAAMAVVGAEPLRESGQRVLITAYLDEGNWVEAEHALVGYSRLLAREFGVAPSAALTRLVRTGREAAVSR